MMLFFQQGADLRNILPLICFNFVHHCYFRVIETIFSEVDKHIEAGDLLSEFKMSALPNLYAQFVELIKYLVMVDTLHWYN